MVGRNTGRSEINGWPFSGIIYGLRSSPLRPNIFFLMMVDGHHWYKRKAEEEEEGREEETGGGETGR